MKQDELIEFRAQIDTRLHESLALVQELAPASPDVASTDHKDDAFAEAIFLRAFTAYENDIEKLFLHYVTGGLSVNGFAANTFLKVREEDRARKIIKAGNRFLYWAKPQDIMTAAEIYIEKGWPIVDMLTASTHVLIDCEKIRNRIAHASLEANQQFNSVQRNYLGTERIFPITPGQFLRIRHKKIKGLHLTHFLIAINSTLIAILEPSEHQT